MKKLIAGNWKMNGSIDESKRLIADIINGVDAAPDILERCDLVVCPSFLHIGAVRHAAATTEFIGFGGQDCAATDNGAYTGDVSAAMLKDAKCDYVILGHSERRHGHGETDETVAAKAAKAHEQGLTAIICVGETEAEREAGQEKEVVERQIKASMPPSARAENTVIAYEPVWAIGTGKTASAQDVKDMHLFIRQKLQERVANHTDLRILYGGSMKPDNAGELLATDNVDGGLIGGASLKAGDFLAIAQNA